MSYLNPELQPYFEMLPINIKNDILESNVDITDLRTLLSIVDGYLGDK